jgi:hypothetical protein
MLKICLKNHVNFNELQQVKNDLIAEKSVHNYQIKSLFLRALDTRKRRVLPGPRCALRIDPNDQLVPSFTPS